MGKETGGKACISVSQIDLGFWSNFQGRRVSIQNHWWSRFPLESFETSLFMVRYGKGASALDLPGQRFWSCSHHAPVLWFRSLFEVKIIFHVYDPTVRLVVLFCCVWKTNQDLVRNKIGPVWGWFSSYRGTTVYLFIHSPTEGCPSYIWVLLIMNKMAVNICVSFVFI